MQEFLLDPLEPYQGKHRRKMMTVIFFCLVASLLLFGTAWAGSRYFERVDAATNGTRVEAIDTSTFFGKVKSLFAPQQARLTGLTDDRINVVLFGIGGDGHEGAQLTDTILVASIKPSTKQVALISIPRDTVVDIPNVGFRKINEVNAFAESATPGTGGQKATETVENFLGINIPYYVRVDFQGFSQLIDDVDGVDVYVDKPFSDNQFPTLDYKYRSVSFQKGWQHMNGATVLDFARSRHGNNFEGSDFARAHRQQKIILAVREKLLSGDTILHPTRITNIIQTLDSHILTNVRFNDIMEFIRLAGDIHADAITNIVFSDDPASVLYADDTSGAFYLRPKDPTLGQIRTLVQTIFDPNAAVLPRTFIDQQPLIPDAPKDARIEVQNGTWRPGFASRQKKKLEADGFKITTIGNAALRPATEAQIYAVTNKYPKIFEALKKKYNAHEILNRPPVSPDNENQEQPQVDIVVVLGENVPDIE